MSIELNNFNGIIRLRLESNICLLLCLYKYTMPLASESGKQWDLWRSFIPFPKFFFQTSAPARF